MSARGNLIRRFKAATGWSFGALIYRCTCSPPARRLLENGAARAAVGVGLGYEAIYGSSDVSSSATAVCRRRHTVSATSCAMPRTDRDEAHPDRST